MVTRTSERRRIRLNPVVLIAFAAISAFSAGAVLNSCGVTASGDADLAKNTYVELVDWHISGLWVINSPVAWVRVANYNNRTIKDVTIQYNTFDSAGAPLDQGTSTLESGGVSTVAPGSVKNFIEQYLGLVNVRTDKMSIKLLSVNAE